MIATRLTDALADRYRIESELGQGGMATVYLARDIRHDRDVAIKVLHPDLGAALGSERFLSEIRTTARLQHPHILPLLDSGEADGLLYYVMPLVTGETLRSRLDREKQLPIDDAVRIAGEVADALGYAHSHGVIHRDIKPENILLQGGHALVADFGIALAVQTAGGQRMTQTGLSLGTPQYMSPEQAMGERTIDARSDIYSLSAVAYEMLIGEAPFTGPTVQAIVARVMSEDPRPLITQRKSIPDYVDYAILRGLDKLPADRWASAGEFAEALKGNAASMPARHSAARTIARKRNGEFGRRLRDPLVLALGAIAVVTTGIAAWKSRATPSAPAQVVRFAIPAIESSHSSSLGLSTLSISPDGQNLVYVGKGDGGREQLMIRNLGEITARALPETENAANPFFSPDGKSVGFFRGNQIYKIAIDGGRVQLLGTAPGTFNGASWSSTGKIVVSGNSGLFAMPEGGGQFQQLGKPDTSHGEVYQDVPIVIDDGRSILYSSWPRSAINDAKIAITSIETGKSTIFNVLGSSPLGVFDGVLVYVTASGALMGVKIDIANRRLLGEPVQLVTDVAVNAVSGLARASLSSTGTLVYQTKSQLSKLVVASRGSAPRVLLNQPGEYSFPRLSPDGKRIALTIASSDRRDIWVYEMSSGTLTKLTTDGKANDRPEWSPDGKYVLYRSDRDVQTAIWWRPADMSAPSAQLLGGGSRLALFEAVISPDAHYVAYQVDTSGADIFYRAMNGDTTEKPIAASTTAIETMPRISPNGKWIAFATDESGTNEVVVQPFPGPGGRVQVSAGGGSEPVWSRDGTRLFYRSDSKFFSARVNAGSTFEIVSRDTVFTDDYVYATNPHANYDVMPDGEHFLFLKPASEGSMIVAANWGSVLRARMAGKTVQ